MSEAALEKPKPKGPQTFLHFNKFLRTFMVHAQPQREPQIALKEATDTYAKVMNDPSLNEEGKKFVLESIAVNAGAAQGVTNLVRNAKAYWKLVQ